MSSTLDAVRDAELRATKKALADMSLDLKFTRESLVKLDAHAALADAGCRTPLLSMNMAAAGRVVSNGRDVEYRIGAATWVSREEYVAHLRRDPETSRFFADSKPAQRPSSALPPKNPWNAKHFNLTAQMAIIRNDPDLAARLKAEADI